MILYKRFNNTSERQKNRQYKLINRHTVGRHISKLNCKSKIAHIVQQHNYNIKFSANKCQTCANWKVCITIVYTIKFYTGEFTIL